MPDYADSPFNPGYGIEPPRLAGRQEIQHEVLLGLQRGPGRDEFHHIIVGGRGTGKTVLLQHLREHVQSEWRWSTIAWQGRDDWPLQQVLAEEQARVERELTGRVRRTAKALRPDTVTAGVPHVASATKSVGTAGSATPSPTALLRRFGQVAAAAGRSVALVVDELQNAKAQELAALSGSLQLVSNQERLPVALVAAGLSNTKAMLRSAKATYIERQETIRIGNLDDDATRDALESPILDAGRTITDAALALLVTESGGYPYAIQLVGKHTWQAAGDSRQITLDHARRGARAARQVLADNMFGDRWDDLTDREREYMAKVVEMSVAGVGASTSKVALEMGSTIGSMSRVRDSLINRHHVLRAGRTGYVLVDIPGFGDWLAGHDRSGLRRP